MRFHSSRKAPNLESALLKMVVKVLTEMKFYLNVEKKGAALISKMT